MFYWQDEGEVNVIDIYLKNAPQNANLYMGLFTAPIEASWTEASLYAALTEVGVINYVRQALAPADWAVAGSIAEQPYKQFDFGADVTALGYFIINTSIGTGKLLAVEYFTAPKSMLAGEILKVKAKIEVK